MLIAQISDTHIAKPENLTCGIAPMAENLACCIEHINCLEQKPDLVLVTGDISNEGAQEELVRAANLLDRLHCPYYVLPGNHDSRSAVLSVFGKTACPTESEDFINYVIDGYDVCLIGLDSTIPGAPGGEICETRAIWLDQCLSEAKEQPTIIFMHHPPLNFGVAETNIDGFTGADLLGNVIEKYNHIERILCGHIHLPALSRWRGTVVSTAPSPGMHLVLKQDLNQPSEFFLTQPCYQLHDWTAEKNLITHTVTVRKSEQNYLFKSVESDSD